MGHQWLTDGGLTTWAEDERRPGWEWVLWENGGQRGDVLFPTADISVVVEALRNCCRPDAEQIVLPDAGMVEG